jgi:cytosine/adenosine deaminase-related metal-dependent hydrolase
MGSRLVIRGGLVVGDGAPGEATVVVEAGLVSAVVRAPEAVPTLPSDWDVDAAGRLVVPGAVDPHTHLALGGLARLAGLRGSASIGHSAWRATLRAGVEPRADARSMEALTAAGAVAALKAGVTCVFDLVRGAPGHAMATLAATAHAVEAVGLRAVVAYAASDRAADGEGVREVSAAGAFAACREGHPTVRAAAGLDGLDATPDTLIDALALAARRHGLLASVGEDAADLHAAYFRAGRRPVDLLADRGLLGTRTVVAHGSTTVSEEGLLLAASGAMLCATPRAASFWGAPLPPIAELAAGGATVVVGTDGLYPDLASELAATKLLHAGPAWSPRAQGALFGDVLWPGAARLAGLFFGGRFGVIAAGAVADLVVLDWRPPVPLPPVRVGDLALLWAGAPAAWAIVGGEVRLREGRLLGADEEKVAERARAATAHVLG